MSRAAIEDFEEAKGPQKKEHDRLLADLTVELTRYEQAVNGAVFLEQFQSTVGKCLG